MSHTPAKSSLNLLPTASLLTAIVSVQVGASLAKGLFPAVGAQGVTALRVTLAALVLALVWRPWRGGPLSKRDLRNIALYGAALGLMNLLFYVALTRIPLGVAVALEFTGPLALAVSASRRPLDFVWIVLAIAGLALLLPFGAASGGMDMVGAAFAVGAGVCWALYILFGQKAGDAVHGGRAAALGMVVATAIVLPFGVAEAGAKLLDPSLLPMALGVAVLSSALPFSLEMVALTRMPTRVFGVMLSLDPAVAALIGLAVLGERLSLLQWAAVGLIVAASAGSAATAQKRAPAPDTRA